MMVVKMGRRGVRTGFVANMWSGGSREGGRGVRGENVNVLYTHKEGRIWGWLTLVARANDRQEEEW